MFLKTDT